MPYLSQVPWDRPWWVKVLIVLSIALNIFFLAFVMGQAWHGWHRQPACAALSPREVLRQLERRLPESDARVPRQSFASRAA